MIQINNIYFQDCLIGMKDINNRSINLILTDPPYGITAEKWDKIVDFNELWEEYRRIITNDGVIVIFGQEPFSSLIRTSNFEMYKYDIYWKKQKPSNFQLMGYQMGRIVENIMIFSKAKACYTKNGVAMCYNPQTTPREKVRKTNAKIYGEGKLLHQYKTDDNIKEYKDKQPINVLEYNTVTKNKIHPTQKPVDLLEYLIKTFSNEGDVVLDPFMGSGSTAIAAISTKRNFIGFEKDENFYQIAVDRIHSQKLNLCSLESKEKRR